VKLSYTGMHSILPQVATAGSIRTWSSRLVSCDTREMHRRVESIIPPSPHPPPPAFCFLSLSCCCLLFLLQKTKVFHKYSSHHNMQKWKIRVKSILQKYPLLLKNKFLFLIKHVTNSAFQAFISVMTNDNPAIIFWTCVFKLF
jgi:hypothetical protein